jgi:hypothetical protein
MQTDNTRALTLCSRAARRASLFHSRASTLLLASALAVGCAQGDLETSNVNSPAAGLDSSVPAPAPGGADGGGVITPPVPPASMSMHADAMMAAARDGAVDSGIGDAAPRPPTITQDGGGVGDAAAGDAGPAPAADASAFPPVAVDKLTMSGGFMAVTKTGVGPGSGFNVYHPRELGQNGLKHPVLTWGNGAVTTPDLYPLLPALATHGFVVIAAQTSFVDGATLKSGLDWMLAQNSASGEFQGKLDPTKVAAFGYSLGSLATFDIGTDPRLTTTVHISGGLMGSDRSKATAIKVPTAYFCDKDETAANCDGDFAAQHTNPTFYARAPGQVHVDYVFDSAFINRMNAPVIAWLRWRLMGDQAMTVMFVGADCTLCKDPAWEVMKKNMD